jgi:uncharacterized OsmC-like protein
MSVGEAISAREQTIVAEPDRARIVYRTAGELAGPMLVKLSSRKHSIEVDEPKGIGGGDAAASPVEYALMALASCQAITYRLWATKLGIALDGLEIAVEGDLDLHGFFGLDDGTRAGFMAIRIDVTPIGPEPERFPELADAVDAHCPVLDLIASPTPVERRLRGQGRPAGDP